MWLGVEASNKVMIIGFADSDDGKAAVARGKMAATVAPQPALIGFIAVAMADKTIKGLPVVRSIPVPLQIVSK